MDRAPRSLPPIRAPDGQGHCSADLPAALVLDGSKRRRRNGRVRICNERTKLSTSSRCRVLSLQPFYGGSHKQFIDNWKLHSDLNWTELTLPDRFWKWRMRHSAIWFAEHIQSRVKGGEHWDVLVVTDMCNVAELRGLLVKQAPAVTCLPTVLYFHENQFAYPSRFAPGSLESKRDLHFAFTNFSSSLAADQLWFNSKYNRDSMLAGLRQQANHWPDHVPYPQIESLTHRSEIFPPGISIPQNSLGADRASRIGHARTGTPMHLIWAARWEHDKCPETLLKAMIGLREESIPFRISVLGQQFRQVPEAFERIQQEFPDQIVNWGWQESRVDFLRIVSTGDIFVSTAGHEFFGIAAAEAIALGLRPVLPGRLAYPELLCYLGLGSVDRYCYSTSSANRAEDADNLKQHLIGVDQMRRSNPEAWLIPELDLKRFRQALDWAQCSKVMDGRLCQIAADGHPADDR